MGVRHVRQRALILLTAMAGLVLSGVAARAANESPSSAAAAPPAVISLPVQLSLLEEPESIFAPPAPPQESERVNEGGVNLRLNATYMSNYVYRGIDRSKLLSGAAGGGPNLQFDGTLEFNLGKLPHPFIGLFVNVFNEDPLSRFQEIRPYFGFDWNIKPLTLQAGQINYIFPEREKRLNTEEAYAKLTLNDAALFHSHEPVLSPYVYGAYDYDRYDGFYLEAGISHDIAVEDTGIILTAVADVGYVLNNAQFSAGTGRSDDSGFQHYEAGLIGSYSLNSIFNLPRRYGEWKLKGYLFYTDGIDNKLRADTLIWGGGGISFEY